MPENEPLNTTPDTVPPVMATAPEFWVAIEPRPNAVRALPALPNAMSEPSVRLPVVACTVLPVNCTLPTEADVVPTFIAVATPVPL